MSVRRGPIDRRDSDRGATLAPDLETHLSSPALELGELRLLRDARTGSAAALAELWEASVDETWSIARALLGEAQAVEALRVLRGQLQDRARGLTTERSWRDQVFELLWAVLWERVQPAGDLGIQATGDEILAAASRPRRDDARERMRLELERAPTRDRMIYLFHLVGRCPSAAIARYSGIGEAEVRKSRTTLAFRVLMASRS